MQKRVLVVEQSVKQAHEIAKLIRAISMDILVIEVYDIEAAYQCAAERVIDVFVVGVIPCNRLEVQEYKFIENLRNIRRYMFAPVILISNIEDISGYIFRRLHCYEHLERPINITYMEEVLRSALYHTTDRRVDKSVYIKRDNVVYPVLCRDIVYARVNSRVLQICMQDSYMHEIPYMTMQRFISYADHPHLVQCARNTLINTRRIRNIDITNRLVTMTNGDVVDIGVSYVGRLKEYLEHKF